MRSIENKPNTHTIRALYIRSYIKVREKGDKLQCSCSCELCWEFVSDISSSVSSPYFTSKLFMNLTIELSNERFLNKTNIQQWLIASMVE